ncbi:carbohydrate kinase [candidate division KSB1 bacterium]|nr:carbohydrate kinase [candidate division KSB1 bacterium]
MNRNKKKYRIAGLGEVLWDIYDDKKLVGGAPANFAAHVTLAGHQGLLLSRVGEDQNGDELMAQLSRFGLDVASVQRDSTKPTGTVRVTVDAAGKPSFQCSHDVAFDALAYDRPWRDRATEVDAVLFGTLAQRHPDSRTTIQAFLADANQALKIFDLNLRGWNEQTAHIVEHGMHVCQVLKINDEELAQLQRNYSGPAQPEPYLQYLLDTYNLQMAALTLGAGGCLLVTPDESVRHPGYRVRVVDTTGCGDAFAAALVVGYLEGAALHGIADFANRLGAFVACYQGAVPRWHYHNLESIG